MSKSASEISNEIEQLKSTNHALCAEIRRLQSRDSEAEIINLNAQINSLKATINHLQTGDDNTLRLQIEYFRKRLIESQQRQRQSTSENNHLKKKVNEFRELATQSNNQICLGCVDRKDWQLIGNWSRELIDHLKPVLSGYHHLYNLTNIVQSKTISRTKETQFHSCGLELPNPPTSAKPKK